MQNLVITNAGQELMTSLITKGTTASFTKIATSEHAYEKEELGNLPPNTKVTVADFNKPTTAERLTPSVREIIACT